eukprot:3084399-Pyramimonas_sp.AAC.1
MCIRDRRNDVRRRGCRRRLVATRHARLITDRAPGLRSTPSRGPLESPALLLYGRPSRAGPVRPGRGRQHLLRRLAGRPFTYTY